MVYEKESIWAPNKTNSIKFNEKGYQNSYYVLLPVTSNNQIRTIWSEEGSMDRL